MKNKKWHITYRGSLSSCNYDCGYCPFAKTTDNRVELAKDYQALARFVDWVQTRKERVSILFTPWGEALVRKPYQQALKTLSHSKNVARVAIQTNLSGNLKWVNDANKSTLALWTTFHPSQTSEQQFLEKCQYLYDNQIRFSVGTVGLKADLGAIESLKKALPPSVYLWVNAYKDEPDYYQSADIQRIKEVDHLFDYNRQDHHSLGEACAAGADSFMVKHNGDIQRCHFIKDDLANIYQPDFEQQLMPSACTRNMCDCHIGYIHLKKLKLNQVFEHGMVERIPNLPRYQ